MTDPVLSGIDSIVLFRNSQGNDGRGTLIHITRTNVVFEVYNPYSIVQISEVLQTVRILRGERMIYHGQAVVNNMVTTGLMTIVSATLLDAWSDLHGLTPGRGLREETRRFVQDWQAGNRLRPEYQLVVGTLRNFLGELSRWLQEAEAGLAGSETAGETSASATEAFYQDIQEPIAPRIIDLFNTFEQEAARIPPDQVASHKAFARRELHPLTLCSPFVHRTYIKPLGYAGDYEMVNMMLGESETRPGSTYAKIVDVFHIQTAAPQAHRNRIDMLIERLDRELSRVSAQERPLSVLNIGCGPAVEIQRFLHHNPMADLINFDLMDFNPETLQYTETRLQKTMDESGRRPNIRFIRKSIDELLREAHSKKTSPGTYDYVYCAGLFDYFSDRICKQLTSMFWSWASPGGLVSVTNVHARNPNRYQMEHLLEWYLVYRDDADMRALAPPEAPHEIVSDPTGVNVFLDLRKPGAA